MDSEIKLRGIMKDAGFSLVELLITVALMGIIFAIAALSMTSMSRTAKLNEIRDQLLADIEEIKLKSISGVPQGIFVSGGNNTSYTVRKLKDFRCSITTTTACLTDADCTGGAGTCTIDGDMKRTAGEATSTLSTFTLNTGYRISWSDADGELWFDRKGMPRTDTWGVTNNTFRIWYDSDGDTVKDANEPAREIGVDNGGRIQYEQ